MTCGNDQSDSDFTVTTTGPTRVTFNATGRAVVAPTTAAGDNLTAVIDATVRLTATRSPSPDSTAARTSLPRTAPPTSCTCPNPRPAGKTIR